MENLWKDIVNTVTQKIFRDLEGYNTYISTYRLDPFKFTDEVNNGLDRLDEAFKLQAQAK